MRIWVVWVCVMTAAVLLVHGGSAGEGESLDGSAADLAWLLVQEEESPSSQPQTGAQVSVRRITPKSVFMAPTFTSCSEGYRQDSLGRCVKVVKVNPSAQWDFFLHKLNSMYGPPEPNKRPANTGPFRLPIPLATESPTTSTTTVRIATTTTQTELPTTSTITTTALPSTSTFIPTSADEQTTDQPFLIVVANTTELPSTTTVTVDTTSTQSTTTNEPTTTAEISTTTLCADCEYPTTLTTTLAPLPPTTTPTTTSQEPVPLRTTIVFPEESHVHRRRPAASSGGTIVRFPEQSMVQQQQQQQSSPHWWPHSWEHRLWQPQTAYYPPPRLTSYHGHREGRPAWRNNSPGLPL
uniref:Venom protein family 22 protein 1 n=1 Tax=Pristhesancus plagipennis TaxID=1955184 RepID=A0A2K8JLM7_PRIPG|nr:venom protein family 22 protein 1 [Pristhesancus plagipennis]